MMAVPLYPNAGRVFKTFDTVEEDFMRALGTTQGPQGDQGDQGAQGFQGDQGPQGFQGFQGTKGDQGDQGSQGDQGPQGDFGGPQGPQGFQGEQGFQGDIGDKGDQGDQGPQGFQGSKTAIVELDNGYAALFCMESGDVRFEEVMVAMPGNNLIDRRFVEVCEPGTISVVGWSADTPGAMPGFLVRGHSLAVASDIVTRFTVKLSGIRRGRRSVRFPTCTAEQKSTNDSFWGQAHAA